MSWFPLYSWGVQVENTYLYVNTMQSSSADSLTTSPASSISQDYLSLPPSTERHVWGRVLGLGGCNVQVKKTFTVVIMYLSQLWWNNTHRWKVLFYVCMYIYVYVCMCVCLTITIPGAWMGSESIAQEGRMGYCLRGHEIERNNCCSKIHLVGQKNIDTKDLVLVKARL